MNKKYLLALNYVFAASMLYMAFNGIEYESIRLYMSKLDLKLIGIAAVVSIFFRLFFYPWLWRRSFISSGIEAGYKDIFLVNAASMPLKFILPFKIAEIVRPAGLRIVGNVDFSHSLGVMIFLRIAVTGATVALFITSSLLLGDRSSAFAGAVLAVVLLLIMMLSSRIPEKIFGKNTGSLNRCFTRSSGFARVGIFAGSVLMQTGEIITSFIILSAFGVSVPIVPFVYAVGLIMLVSMVPFSIQGIGIRETAAVIAFGKFVSPELGLAAGVFITIIHHVIPAFAGAFVWFTDSTMRAFFGNAVAQLSDR